MHATQKTAAEQQPRAVETEAPTEVGAADSAAFLLGAAGRYAAGAPPEDPTGSVGAYLHVTGRTARARVSDNVQRCAGNTALRQMVEAGAGRVAFAPEATALTVQRAKLDPSMLKADKPPPPSGKVTVSKTADQVTLSAPEVRFTTNVKLETPADTKWEDLDVGKWIQTGPTQSVVSSERVAVYTKGGVQGGEETSRSHTKLSGPTRDAQTDPKTKKVKPNVHAPWYSLAQFIQAAPGSATFEYLDQPSQDFPVTQGSGTITEFRGQEKFITSIAANTEKSKDLMHLEKMEWEIDWNVKVDAAGKGEGGGVTGKETKSIPPTLDGPIAVEAAETWVNFRTPEEAAKFPTEVLLRYLGAANTHDKAAANTIMIALRNKKASFTVSVTSEHKSNTFFNDDIWVELSTSGGKKVQKDVGPSDLDKDGTGTAVFMLEEVLDLATLKPSEKIKVVLIHKGVLIDDRSMAQFVNFPFATSPAVQFLVAKGSYKLTWSASS